MARTIRTKAKQASTMNRPGVRGDSWPWKIKDGVHAYRSHSWEANDASVFAWGEAGRGEDVRSLQAETGMTHGAVRRVAQQLGYGVESVRSWVKLTDVDDGVRPGMSTREAQRLKELEQENRELRRANEILRRAATFFGAELDRQQRR